jgi:hypothetical protein
MTVILQSVPSCKPAPRHALVLVFSHQVVRRDGVAVKLTKSQFRLFTYLACAAAATLPGAVDFLWGERADGGPSNPRVVMAQWLSDIRACIGVLGLRIVRLRQQLWRLVDIDTGLPLRQVPRR